ncbi:MAG: hypothetical protein GX298_00125 [Planctomycetes bacterium]|nr:hypothetical protein [Planctomycetota bacterium]
MSNKMVLSEMQHTQSKGLECLGCGCYQFYTAWTRHYKNRTVRSKVCRHCGRKHQTVERVVK